MGRIRNNSHAKTPLVRRRGLAYVLQKPVVSRRALEFLDAGQCRSKSSFSSLERDFCRRRQTRKKGARGDVSEQRPEIGDHDAREMAAKTAFLVASCQLRVAHQGSNLGPAD